MDIFYPIQLFSDWLVLDVFKIAKNSALFSALNFFIFDIIKILILLAVIIFCVSIIRTFLSPEKIRSILAHKNKYWGNILAALFGIVTPFCTCSAIPLFLGFVQAGVPLGATFSFLIASPMINEVAIVMLFGLFGLKITAIYILSGFIIAILSGIIIGNMKVEDLIEDFVFKNQISSSFDAKAMSWNQRFLYARDYTKDIIKQVWLYLLVGIGIGAWMHGYVPADFLAQYAGADKWYGVIVATLIGIPLYGNGAAIMPLIGVMVQKGVAMGTALAFAMAVTGLSAPEFMILKKVMKTKLIIIFASIVGLGIIFTGYLFNWIL